MYNNKVLVKSVVSSNQFLAVPFGSDEQGQKVMDDLREKDVETVLPSTSNWNSQNVMVLKGEFKGELAKILEKDKKKEKVTV